MAFLPRTQPYNLSSTGDANTGLFEDVATRSLQTVRVGFSAGKTATGLANTLVGYESGKIMGNTNYTTCIGFQAGANNDTVQYSTFVGAFSGNNNINGSELVYIGYSSGRNSKYAKQCVGIGAYTLFESETSLGVTAVGHRAGEKILDASYNTMIGAESGQDNRSGNNNTMAGYRSGRSTYIGHDNTYMGANSGYSNTNGNANSFFGYKSGEKILGGDYNVSIGAFSFQNASYASCNIIIGPFAYSGNTSALGSNVNIMSLNNVLIGTNVAHNATNLSRTLVLGGNAGSTLNGDGSVVLGYNSGFNCYSSYCNIFVGVEASSYSSNNSCSYGIAIGSFNTKTTDSSISIGNDIINRKNNCVSLGYNIRSDAKNSVIIGNDIIITSVTNFKDPLYYPLKSSVETDAFNKLGLSNLSHYTSNKNVLINPNTQDIYGYANFGLLTSNSYIAPYTIASNFSLIDAVNNYAIINGSVYNITNNNFNSNVRISPDIISNTSFTSDSVVNNLASYAYYNNIQLGIILTENAFINLFNYDNELITDFYFVKNVATPYISSLTSTVNCSSNYGNNIFDLNISYFENSGLLSLICNVDFYISTPPKYGIIINNSNYISFPEYMFATSNDSFKIVSYYGINTDSEYLATSNSYKNIVVNNPPLGQYIPSTISLQNNNYRFNTSEFINLTPKSFLQFNSFDPSITLNYNNVSYLSSSSPTIPFTQINNVSLSSSSLAFSNINITLLNTSNFSCNVFSNILVYSSNESSNALTSNIKPVLSNVIYDSNVIYNSYDISCKNYNLNPLWDTTLFLNNLNFNNSFTYTCPIPLNNIYISSMPNNGVIQKPSIRSISYTVTNPWFTTDSFNAVFVNTLSKTVDTTFTITNTNIVSLPIVLPVCTPTRTLISSQYQQQYTNILTSPAPSNINQIIVNNNTIYFNYMLSSNTHYQVYTCNLIITSNIQNSLDSYNSNIQNINISNVAYNNATRTLITQTYNSLTSSNINTLNNNSPQINTYNSNLLIKTEYYYPNNKNSQRVKTVVNYSSNYNILDSTTPYIYSSCNVVDVDYEYLVIETSNLSYTTTYNTLINRYTSNIPVFNLTKQFVYNPTEINYNVSGFPVVIQNSYNIHTFNTTYSSNDLLANNVYIIPPISNNVTIGNNSTILRSLNDWSEIFTTVSITLDPITQSVNLNTLFSRDAQLLTNFTPKSIYIVSVNNGALTANSSLISYQDLNNIYPTDIVFLATNRNATATIKYYYKGVTTSSQTQSYSHILVKRLKITITPNSYGIDINNNLARDVQGFIYPQFYYAQDGIDNLTFNVTNNTNVYNVATNNYITIFTTSDLPNLQLRTTNAQLLFTIKNNITNVTTNGTFPIKQYSHFAFSINNGVNNIYNSNIGNNTPAVYTAGYIWDWYKPLSNLNIIVTKQPTKGVMYDSSRFVATSLEYTKISNFHYISFNSDNIENDTISIKFGYQNALSPEYVVNLKNYFSRFTDNFPLLNTGLIQDGYSWQNHSVNGNSIIWELSNGKVFIQDYKNIQYRLNSNTSSNIVININIDQADSEYISKYIPVTKNWIYYISTKPTNGIIQNAITSNIVSKFNTIELSNIIYQHLGTNSLTDYFTIGVATNDYDFIDNVYLINITCDALPLMLTNDLNDLNYANSVDALTEVNNVANTTFNNNCFLHVIEEINVATQSNVYFAYNILTNSNTHPQTTFTSNEYYTSNVNSNLIFTSNVNSNLIFTSNVSSSNISFNSNLTSNIYYTSNINSNFLFTSNVTFIANNYYYKSSDIIDYRVLSVDNDIILEPFKIIFTPNNTVNKINKLTQNPTYSNLFVKEIVGYVNHTKSYSDLIDILPEIQRLDYTFTSNISFLNDKTVNVSMLMKPIWTTNALQLQTLNFKLNIGSYVTLDIYNAYTYAYIKDSSIPIKCIYSTKLLTESTKWNYFAVKNYDNLNNNLALYINDDIFDLGAPLQYTHLSNINVQYDTKNVYNYLASSNYPAAPLDNTAGDIYTSIDVKNYHNNIAITNFTVQVSLYKYYSSPLETSKLYNVIAGKYITVNGFNNVCLGNNFVTSGENSIIIGNQIGQTRETNTATLNDIYNSIIIGNNSYSNAIVRDIISIGKNLFNNFSLLETSNQQKFLATSPVIIGNSIDTDKIDYNINIDNTFLKTTVGGDQIYLGLNNEAVSIGYNGNNSNIYNKLYVNGNIKAKNIDATQTLETIADNNIPLYTLVSSTGEYITNMLPYDRLKVIQTNVINDNTVIGICICSKERTDLRWDINVATSGHSYLYCDSQIHNGDKLISSLNGLGFASSNIENTICKALSGWNPMNISETPWVSTSNNYGLIGVLI